MDASTRLHRHRLCLHRLGGGRQVQVMPNSKARAPLLELELLGCGNCGRLGSLGIAALRSLNHLCPLPFVPFVHRSVSLSSFGSLTRDEDGGGAPVR